MVSAEPEQTLRIHLFGTEPRLSHGDGALARAVPIKVLALLAFLALHADRPVSRNAIASALWPDVGDDEARANLRRHLSLLNRYLPPPKTEDGWVLSEGRTLRWNTEAGAWIDVVEFERLLAEPASRAKAVELYAGDVFERLDDEWLAPLREARREKLLDALFALFDDHERAGRVEDALLVGRRLIRTDPMRENVVRRMMLMRARAGDRAGALQEFKDFERRLREDVAAEPMRETRVCYEQIVAGQIEPLVEVSATAEPPRRAIENLPQHATRFFGRESELALLRGALGRSRSVTLTGVGGIGKSRLAQRLATDAADRFPGGIWFVDLTPLDQEHSVGEAVAAAFALENVSPDVQLDLVADRLRDVEALLVLDNCEVNLGGCRELVSKLLGETRRLVILATSRESLRVQGEFPVVLGPLETGAAKRAGTSRETSAAGRRLERSPAAEKLERSAGPEILERSAAEALFLDRARAFMSAELSEREEAALDDICGRLDGIPLALELAAARTKVFSLPQLAARLGDPALVLDFASPHAAPHQRTVRSVIAWSYNALPDAGRVLLRRASIFRSSFSLDAAEALGFGLGLGEGERVFDVISTLVDFSLAQPIRNADETRFRLLEPVRDFALEALTESGESAESYRRNITFFTAYALALDLPDAESNPRRAFDAIDVERANIHESIRGAVRHQTAIREAMSLLHLLSVFFQERGSPVEAWNAYRDVLGAMPSEIPPIEGADFVNEACTMARLAGDYGRAQELAARALRENVQIGNLVGQAESLTNVGFVEYILGSTDSARARHEAARQIFLEIGDEARANRADANIALTDLAKGYYDEAVIRLEPCVEALRTDGNRRWYAAALSALGYAERFRHSLESARRCSEAAWLLASDLGIESIVVTSLGNLAHVCILGGDEEAGLYYLQQGFERLRARMQIFSLTYYLELASQWAFAAKKAEDGLTLRAASRTIKDRFGSRVCPTDSQDIGDWTDSATTNHAHPEALRLKERFRNATIEYCLTVAEAALGGEPKEK